MNIVSFILWLVILFFIGWPVAFFASFLYIICLPFSVCITGCAPLVDLLEKGVKLPKLCAEKMMA